MKKIRKIIFTVILLAAVACGAFYAGIKWEGFIRSANPEIITQEIEGKLADIGELATTEYNYTNVASFENNLKLKDWNIPLTTKRFILQYDGIIKAGIDISKVKISAESGVITVNMPETEILSHEIKEDSIMVLDETNNIFNHIKIEDYSSFATEQKEICEQMAVEKGLLLSAEENAQSAITSLIENISGSQAYSIVFK